MQEVGVEEWKKGSQVVFFENHPILLKRKPYARISLQILSSGTLICHANQKIKLSEIFLFLSSQRIWIDRQSQRIEQLKRQYPPIYWDPKAQVPFMGKFKPLKIFWRKRQNVVMHPDRIDLHIPHQNFTQRQWSDLIASHYKKLGISLLKDRMQKWSHQMSLSPQKLIFRKQKSQWGSCSTSGCISLNWKLIVAPLPVIDYVVIHELAHLRHPNHSRCFWNLVQKYAQNSRECRAWLRRNQFAFDFLEDLPQLHASPYPL